MASQQMVGRAPNVLDYYQMRRLARRTPNVPEQDIEGNNRLRIELVKAIADLEKTKADIKKGVIAGMTDLAGRIGSMQASTLAALADEAKAQGMTKDALASALKNLTSVYSNARGAIASGAPEEDFMTKLGDPAQGIAAQITGMTSDLSNKDAEVARLVQELTPTDMASVVGPGYDGLLTLLDQRYVTGPGGMTSRVAALTRATGNTNMLAANLHGAQSTIAAGIRSAVNNLNAPEEVKQKLYTDLVMRSAEQLQRAGQQTMGNVNIFSDFTAAQSQALQEMNAEAEKAVKLMGVGISPKLKKQLLGNVQAVTDLLVKDDTFAQLEVARNRLAEKGIQPPGPAPEGATPEVKATYDAAKKAYDEQLSTEFRATVPMEGFAQRMATLPVSPEIDKQIAYLKTLLADVGKVTPDALSAATAALRQSMGADQFEAWRRMSGAKTDEDAAVAAARDPAKLTVFRRVAGTEANLLTNPEQYRGVVNTEAANEAAAARQAAKESAAAYAAEGQAVVQPQMPSAPVPAPTPTRTTMPTPDIAGLPEAGEPKVAPTKFDTSNWDISGDLNDGVTPEAAQKAREAQGKPSAMVEPQVQPFQSALAARTGARSQLFGAGGLMGQMARGRG